jgi:DegV family protein with EDD domain
MTSGPVGVVTDSCGDIPAALAADLGITVVPLTIRFGDEQLADGRDVSPREFWDRCRAAPSLPQTAAPSPGAFEAAFRSEANAGSGAVLCVTVSSKLSATGGAARVAASSLDGELPVRVVDSRSATLGQGMIAVAAARMAGDGMALEPILEALDGLVARTRVYGTLDTLENLRRGGRIGGARALIGSVLSIKPIIELRDGVVEAESRQRSRGRALRYLADKVRQQPSESLAVVHGEAPDLDQFLDLLAPSFRREDIVVGDLGAVIGTHTGPGTIGVAFQLAPSA